MTRKAEEFMEGKVEAADRMIRENYSDQDISRLTQLSFEKIKQRREVIFG